MNIRSYIESAHPSLSDQQIIYYPERFHPKTIALWGIFRSWTDSAQCETHEKKNRTRQTSACNDSDVTRQIEKKPKGQAYLLCGTSIFYKNASIAENLGGAGELRRDCTYWSERMRQLVSPISSKNYERFAREVSGSEFRKINAIVPRSDAFEGRETL